MWKNIVELGRPQVTVWRMRFVYLINKATGTHSEYVKLIAFSTAVIAVPTRLNVI
jgi:hypothetical protein